MGKDGFQLEELREIFKDDRIIMDIGIIDSCELAIDRSVLRAKVRMIPDNDIIIARCSWEAVGPDAGFFAIPQAGDLVLVGFANRDEDQGFVLKRLTSQEDTIPLRAATGDYVLQALAGKKLNLGSDTKILLDKGGILEGAEPLVLGEVLKSAQESLYDQFIDFLAKLINGPIGIGNLGGSVPTDPTLIVNLTVIKTQIELDKSVFITTSATNFLSQLAFTER